MGCMQSKVTHVQIVPDKSAPVVLGRTDPPTRASDKQLEKDRAQPAETPATDESPAQRPANEPRKVQVQTTDAVTNVVNTDVVLNRRTEMGAPDAITDPPDAIADVPDAVTDPPDAIPDVPFAVDQAQDTDAAAKLQAALRAQLARRHTQSSYGSPRVQTVAGRTRSVSSGGSAAKMSPKPSLHLVPTSPFVSALGRHGTNASNATDTSAKASDAESILTDRG